MDEVFLNSGLKNRVRRAWKGRDGVGKGKGMHGWGCGHVCACTSWMRAQHNNKGMHLHRHSVRVHSLRCIVQSQGHIG